MATPPILPKTSPGPAAEVDAPRSAPLTGWIVGGAGAVALGVGAAFGLSSLSAYHDADRLCPLHQNCTDDANSKRDRAETQAWVANIGLGLGLVGAGVGAYLILSSRRDASEPRTAIHASPRIGGGSLTVERGF